MITRCHFCCLFQEDEDDGELRRSSYRRRSHSGTSRRSVVSGMSTARPLTTSPPPSSVSHQSPPSSRPHSPPSPTQLVSGSSRKVSLRHQRRYHTFHHPLQQRYPLHAISSTPPLAPPSGSMAAAGTNGQDSAVAHRDHSNSLPSLVSGQRGALMAPSTCLVAEPHSKLSPQSSNSGASTKSRLWSLLSLTSPSPVHLQSSLNQGTLERDEFSSIEDMMAVRGAESNASGVDDSLSDCPSDVDAVFYSKPNRPTLATQSNENRRSMYELKSKKRDSKIISKRKKYKSQVTPFSSRKCIDSDLH